MRSTVTGDYSFQCGKKTRGGRILAGLGLLVFALSFVAATQHFALIYGRNRLAGGVPVAGVRLYPPWQIVEWADRYQRRTKSLRPFRDSLLILGGGVFSGLALLALGARKIRRARQGDLRSIHGSARWANRKEITAASLLPAKGRAGAGVYVGGWVDPRDGRQYYLRHDGKEHVLAIAPTRSGKGVGLVIPTLLSWEHSVVVLDVKGENWVRP